MRVDQYFGAPLLVHDVESGVVDTIRGKVQAWLQSDAGRQAVAPSPEESVETSYYSPERSILEDADLHELQAEILAAAKVYLEQTLGLAPRELEIQQAWINIFEPGAQEAQHAHEGSLLSCSFYVDAPADCGCIVFHDPVGARRTHRQFTQTSGSNLFTRSEIAVEPQPGRLVMFESWMPHSVQCNKSSEVRISIAVNLREAPGARVAPAAVSGGQASGTQHSAGSAAPQPILFNELFDIRSGLSIELKPISDVVPAVVVDDILARPQQVRDVIGSAPAMNWKHEEGGRNFVDYYDCRLRFPIRYPNKLVALAQQIIANVFSVNTRPADASVDVNWFMQINPRRADYAVPHNDITERVQRSFTCIVYLNAEHECSGGTAFFRFRPSNSPVLDEAWVNAVKADPALGETGLDYWAEGANQHWEEIGTAQMRSGRLLIFPSEYFHAAWHPVDSFESWPRLTLAFWMIA